MTDILVDRISAEMFRPDSRPVDRRRWWDLARRMRPRPGRTFATTGFSADVIRGRIAWLGIHCESVENSILLWCKGGSGFLTTQRRLLSSRRRALRRSFGFGGRCLGAVSVPVGVAGRRRRRRRRRREQRGAILGRCLLYSSYFEKLQIQRRAGRAGGHVRLGRGKGSRGRGRRPRTLPRRGASPSGGHHTLPVWMVCAP